MTQTLARYEALITAGELRVDATQRGAAERLTLLQDELQAKPKGGFLSRMFGGKAEQPRGIYMWGSVGRGKTMLMDLFFECVEISDKRRVHFHAFMAHIFQHLRAVFGTARIHAVQADAAQHHRQHDDNRRRNHLRACCPQLRHAPRLPSVSHVRA